MALEFALAVASGLIVALLSSLFRGSPPGSPILEIRKRTELIVHSIAFLDGEIVKQETSALIEESVVRVRQSAHPKVRDIFPVALGILFFVVVLTVLLLI